MSLSFNLWVYSKTWLILFMNSNELPCLLAACELDRQVTREGGAGDDVLGGLSMLLSSPLTRWWTCATRWYSAQPPVGWRPARPRRMNEASSGVVTSVAWTTGGFHHVIDRRGLRLDHVCQQLQAYYLVARRITVALLLFPQPAFT